MQTSNYGRAIASYAARYSARYYRIIIAILVVTLLGLEAVHAGYIPRVFTISGVLLIERIIQRNHTVTISPSVIEIAISHGRGAIIISIVINV